MAELPVLDRAGNALIDFRGGAEFATIVDDLIPMPLSLVVVTLGDTVLTLLNGHRGQWELPGGTRERDETPRQAAARELAEETGINRTDLAFAAVVEFDLRNPSRREYAAVYRTRLRVAPRLAVNDEALDFHWWDPRSSPGDDMSPLDAEIARRVFRTPLAEDE